MDFSLSEEQELLKKSARDFLTEKFPKKLVLELENSDAGFSPDLWKEMADLGWMGLVIPEKYGGAGRGFFELAVLLQEIGMAAAPTPYFPTIVLGVLPLLDLGNEAQKQAYLPKVAAGELIFTLALNMPDHLGDTNSVKVTAIADKDGFVLEGINLFVPYANVADYMLVAARTNGTGANGITLFIVDAKSSDTQRNVMKSIANDKLCEVVFAQVNVPKENILGQVDQGWKPLQKIVERAAIAKCCEMLGGIQRVLDMTVQYVKERVQYGHPIGTFQAIQHYCANMAIDVDGSRLSIYHAAWMLAEGIPCTKEIAIAKAWTNEAYRRTATLAHQIHGALGFTLDHDLHYYLRRAIAAETAFGNTDYHQSMLTRELGF
jgi:alkylation response protein AidB-like acyl-CoA dehydrogenase